jgi:hypothetical protein
VVAGGAVDGLAGLSVRAVGSPPGDEHARRKIVLAALAVRVAVPERCQFRWCGFAHSSSLIAVVIVAAIVGGFAVSVAKGKWKLALVGLVLSLA